MSDEREKRERERDFLSSIIGLLLFVVVVVSCVFFSGDSFDFSDKICFGSPGGIIQSVCSQCCSGQLLGMVEVVPLEHIRV